MSVEAMSWVFKHSPYALAARLVHLALADVANDDYENRVWLSQPSIAAKANISVSQVSRSLKRMVEDGALVLVEKGVGRGNLSVYQLVLKTPQYDGFSDDENPATATIKPRNNDDENPATAESHLLLTQEELNRTQQLRSIVDDHFDEFWAIYPRRNGIKVGKAKALEVWRKLTPNDRREAYRGAVNLAAAVDQDLTLPKDATRFLKHRCWDDWQDPAAPSTNGNGHRPDPMRRGRPPLDALARSVALDEQRPPLPIGAS